MTSVSVLVTSNLDFDVTWLFNVFLHVDTIVAERSLGFPARGIPGLAIHPVTTRSPLATQDQVAVLGLSRSDAGVDVVVQFWPVDGRSSRPLMTHNITLK